MEDEIKISTVKNLGYNSFGKILVYAFSGISSIILARNLSASDYGVMGFANIFISFLARFADLGINNAIIQKYKADDKTLYTGFSIRAFSGVVVFLIAISLSPLSKKFFDNPAVSNVIIVLSLNFIISTFSFLPNCVLTREINYRKLLLPQIVPAIISSFVSIVLALNGFKYWSVVIAQVLSAIASAVFTNAARPIKIMFKFDKHVAQELIYFGGNIFLSGILIFIIFNADNFIIGTSKGSKELGYYAIAFNWGSLVCTLISSGIHTVLFPTMSRFQNNKLHLKKIYLKSLEHISFIAVFANIALLILAREFLFFILGHSTDKWMPALTVFQILCFYGIIRSILEPVGNIVLASGKSNILLKSTVFAGIIELTFLYPALFFFDIEGVAVLITVTYSLQYLIYFPLLKNEMEINISDFISAIKPALLCMGIVLSICLLTFKFVATPSINSLIMKLLFIICFYFILYGYLSNWALYKEYKIMLRNFTSI